MLDQSVVKIAQAIRKVESNGRYDAAGGSGEGGAYQFMPSTWKSWAGKYLGDPNAKMDKINQNKVAYYKIKELKDQGFKVDQIASVWNSGGPNYAGKVGTNKYGVKYDTPSYVAKVVKAHATIDAQAPTQAVNAGLPKATLASTTLPSGSISSGQSAYDKINADRIKNKPVAQPIGQPLIQPKAQATDRSNFAVKVDEKRRQGYTDTEIIEGLSKTSAELSPKIAASRSKYANDRELLNAMSVAFSGRAPSVKSNPLRQLPTTPLSKAAATTPFLGNKNQGLINAMKPEAQQAMISGRTAPSSTEAPKFFPGNGTLSNIGNALVSSERAFGDTLGQSVAAISGTGKTIEKANSTYMDTGNKWVQLMKSTTNPAKKASYLKLANDSFAKAGSTYKAVLPAIEKINKQIWGEAAGVGLDVLTAGSYGKAAAGMKTGQLAKAGSTVGKTAPGLLGKIIKPGTSLGNATAKISSTPIPFVVKNILKPGSIKNGVLKGVAGGAALNGLYGAAGAAQEGTDIKKGVVNGALTGAVFGGVLGGVSAKTLKTANKIDDRINGKLGAADTLGSQGKLAQNLNKIIEFSPATTRKIGKFADEQGTDIGAELAKRKILPKVENERMLFDSSHLDDIEREITEKSKVIDEAVSLYKTEIPASDLVKKATQKIKSNQTFANEGRVDEITQKAISKIEDFVKQTGKTSFTLTDLQNFKKGMWSASKKFKMTEIGNADAYSELGHVFKTIIEDEIPDAAIKKINKEIGSLENVSKFLTATDKAGGIVLKGGKLGKYFENIAASSGAGVVGFFAGGPLGGIIASTFGSAIAGKIRTVQQQRAILGIVDRALLKLSKNSTGSQDVAAAMKFIAETKAGKNVTVTPRVQKVISEILKSEYGIGAKTPLMLPAGKTVGTVNNVAMKLPAKSQSTIDELENVRIQSQTPRTTEIPAMKLFEAQRVKKLSNNFEAVNRKVNGEKIESKIQLTHNYDINDISNVNTQKAQVEYEVLASLDTGKGGERFYYDPSGFDDTVISSSTTIPEWIPEGLRSANLMKAVSEHIKEGTIPIKADEVRLYRVVAEEISAQQKQVTDLADDIKNNLGIDVFDKNLDDDQIEEINKLLQQYEQE